MGLTYPLRAFRPLRITADAGAAVSGFRFLEDTSEIKGPAAFVYGCEVGCGAKDSMDLRAPPAAGIKIEGEVIHQQQDSAGYKQLGHSLANRL